MDEERCWQAVLGREKTFDGAFVYAVRSTGIFCRPTCPSRRPRREQVIFFGQPAAAEQAGFRACQRCRPAAADSAREPIGADDARTVMVRRACQIIEEADEAPTLSELGERMGLSPYHLQRTFKRVMGITPHQYADAHRIDRLKARLKKGDNVTTALYEAGYGSSSRLYEQAPERLGMTPATYQRGGAGAQIGYTIADSPLGRLLVAATERGVCFVSLADDDAALETALTNEFPAAEIRRDDAVLGRSVDALVRHLSGEQQQLDLPLDVCATAFQRRVWETLRAIPFGETRSYRQVAEALGQPTAARAVARACATNPVALVIPCHRVVGEGGDLRGYRWGVGRKHALLKREEAER
ncbi:MAG TPA: bifunctional DNA-binding transcriptional regulator/O6-methylguanine-DNA methyltransferase Ada [Roseiflexaceae bacterium]|nr:bifunctional DNA-binding transcriptional regulator/O6-methylguanine-DNA methyltransferase Ada [Roseiflexaceae bacterium]